MKTRIRFRRWWAKARLWVLDRWKSVGVWFSDQRLLLALVAIAVALWLGHPPLPQVGALASRTSLAVFLGSIATTLAAIVAIVVAVVFVALESLREAYAGYASREVFASPALRNLVTVYLFTIALALLVLGSISESVPSSAVPLTYYITFLTLVCLGTLYPASRKILGEARADRRRIQRLVSQLDYTALGLVGDGRLRDAETALQTLEEHPLFLLSEIAIRSIRGGDRITPQTVVLETGKRLSTIIKESADEPYQLRSLINSFLLLLRPVGKASLEYRAEGVQGQTGPVLHQSIALRLRIMQRILLLPAQRPVTPLSAPLHTRTDLA